MKKPIFSLLNADIKCPKVIHDREIFNKEKVYIGKSNNVSAVPTKEGVAFLIENDVEEFIVGFKSDTWASMVEAVEDLIDKSIEAKGD